MRVLQLVYSLDVGGLEQMVADLCNHLNSDGTECYLCCLSHAGAKAQQVVDSHVLICGLNGRKRLPDMEVVRKICHLIRQNDIDLIHSHNPKAQLYGAIASFLTGRPHVQTVHGRGAIGEPSRRALLRRTLSLFSDRIVAVSDDIKAKLVNCDGIGAKKLERIVNGVDTDTYAPPGAGQSRAIRYQLGIPVDSFVIGSVGRLATEKNFPLLIKAFALFRKRFSCGHLVIVGDGPERGKILSVIAQNGIEEFCTLPGSRLDVPDWMKCFDVFTLSSDTEGTSITLLEALATGVPIVASDVGGNRAVVAPCQCGFIVPPNDLNGLCAGFAELMTDAESRRRMSLSARQRCLEHFSVKSMITNYCQLYRCLM
jgi:glycosyltransferase involved in cell wall biosynthesis